MRAQATPEQHGPKRVKDTHTYDRNERGEQFSVKQVQGGMVHDEEMEFTLALVIKPAAGGVHAPLVPARRDDAHTRALA